jgi:hypothetical protein
MPNTINMPREAGQGPTMLGLHWPLVGVVELSSASIQPNELFGIILVETFTLSIRWWLFVEWEDVVMGC